jgi:hypothetical protein
LINFIFTELVINPVINLVNGFVRRGVVGWVFGESPITKVYDVLVAQKRRVTGENFTVVASNI